MTVKTWVDVNAVYQVYLRSFKDTNNDGVGDLRGVIEKLDYLKDTLGVEAVWLSPFYPSPQTDCGYDVSDFTSVDQLFGDMADFDELLEKAHARGLKIMCDLVPNHVSDQHAWFKEARSGRDSPKRDWFVWRDTPNNWLSISGGSCWQYDEASEQYYLHSFMPSQPDLNWENMNVRAAIADVMRFWLDKGVDGFRVDATWVLSKDPEFRDDPPNPQYSGPPDAYGAFVHSMSKNGPRMVEYLKFLAAVASEYDDRYLLFEYYPDTMLGNVNEQLKALHEISPTTTAPFFFEGLHTSWHAEQFGQKLAEYLKIVPKQTRPSVCFSNHDQPRIVSRFGEEQARLIAVLQFTLPGLPVFYNGDEIGMANVDIPLELTKDKFEKTGDSGGRDPYRTPLAWTNREPNGGFSEAAPWLPLGDGTASKNIETENEQEDSYLSLYKKLLAFRCNLVVANGAFELVNVGNGFVLAYERRLKNQRFYVVCNFADTDQTVRLPENAEQVLVESRQGAVRLDGDKTVVIAGYGAAAIC